MLEKIRWGNLKKNFKKMVSILKKDRIGIFKVNNKEYFGTNTIYLLIKKSSMSHSLHLHIRQLF